MKERIVLLLLVLWLPNICFSNRFELQGHLKNVPDTYYVTVGYDVVENGKWKRIIHNSILVENGMFSLSGQVDELSPAYIEINKQRLRFYLEPSKMTLHIDVRAPYNMQLTGTTVDEEFQTYISTFHECDSILTEKFRKAVDWEYTSEYSVDYPGMYSLYTHEKEDKLLAFCKKHPDYKIAPDLLLQALEIDMDSWDSYYDGNKVVKAPKREVFSGITKINKVIRKLPAEITNTNLGKKLLERASIAKAVSECRKTIIGSMAPSFTAVTSTGDSINIANYRDNKYVLLYFWADKISETPYAKEVISNMTKDIPSRDIVRISISTNIDGDEWRQEVHKYGDGYIHAEQPMSTDLYQLFVKQISSLYPFGTLPTYILIDKKGKIASITEGVAEEK